MHKKEAVIRFRALHTLVLAGLASGKSVAGNAKKAEPKTRHGFTLRLYVVRFCRIID